MNKTQGKRMKKIMDMAKRTGEGRVKTLFSPLTKIKLKKVCWRWGGRQSGKMMRGDNTTVTIKLLDSRCQRNLQDERSYAEQQESNNSTHLYKS